MGPLREFHPDRFPPHTARRAAKYSSKLPRASVSLASRFGTARTSLPFGLSFRSAPHLSAKMPPLQNARALHPRLSTASSPASHPTSDTLDLAASRPGSRAFNPRPRSLSTPPSSLLPSVSRGSGRSLHPDSPQAPALTAEPSSRPRLLLVLRSLRISRPSAFRLSDLDLRTSLRPISRLQTPSKRL